MTPRRGAFLPCSAHNGSSLDLPFAAISKGITLILRKNAGVFAKDSGANDFMAHARKTGESPIFPEPSILTCDRENLRSPAASALTFPQRLL